jgi:hypothetical protein
VKLVRLTAWWIHSNGKFRVDHDGRLFVESMWPGPCDSHNTAEVILASSELGARFLCVERNFIYDLPLPASSELVLFHSSMG